MVPDKLWKVSEKRPRMPVERERRVTSNPEPSPTPKIAKKETSLRRKAAEMEKPIMPTNSLHQDSQNKEDPPKKPEGPIKITQKKKARVGVK